MSLDSGIAGRIVAGTFMRGKAVDDDLHAPSPLAA